MALAFTACVASELGSSFVQREQASGQLSGAAPASSSLCVRAPLQVSCGRGDKRTAKGKRTRGSYGNCRPRSNKGGTRLGLPLTPIPAGSVSRHKKLEDDTEYIHIDLDEISVAGS